jgi:acetyltransferase-like isoleucine patch superfamily enzyme
MKKLFGFIGCVLLLNLLHAQTGIGTTTPNASAKLDVYSTNKGFLPPRVTLTSATDATTIASPAEGLLVYNLGSVGLQAGYYYWNGANWATIATATSAGNGVTASNMVNLYSKGYSNATPDSTIANATGYKFTVPVSGRYLFDFSSTGFSNATITYKVRQGTTDLGTDAQTSINNTVHVEYNGKIEVNLQAGVTYNVYVTTTGNRDAGDYDRVYYKLVAGNLPVTGQTVDYVSVSRTGSDQTVNTGSTVVFNTINGGNIPYNTSTGAFSLTAGKTYRLSATLALSNGNSTVAECNVIWKNAAGDLLTNKAEVLSSSHSTNAVGNGNVSIIYTPTVNTTVSLYVSYSSSNAILWQSYTFASVEQIGSSAIVDPWILSGTNTYNTTGNVGIGTNAPTQALDVTGNVNVTGKISLTDPTGSVTTKVAGFVDAGTYVTLDNVRATVNTSGSRGLGLATVSGSFTAFINGTYTVYTGGTNGQGTNLTVTTTTASSSMFGWNFVSQGDASTYIVNDTTNKRIYRITLMIGGGYYSNLITIERLL